MRNMGPADRVIRLLVAVGVALAWGFGLIGGTLALVLGAIALVLFLTSLVSTCPAYMPFGLSTRRADSRPRL